METWPHKKNNFFFQLDPHDGIFLPGPIPVPGWSVHIAWGTFEYPWLGGLFGENKGNQDKVLADGSEVVSRGHEPKLILLPHINLFPFFITLAPNVLIPLIILGSSSKCEFAVGSVVGPDGAIAVALTKFVGLNLACADPVGMPTSFPCTYGTVILGFTWGDLVAGILMGVFDVLKGLAEGAVCKWAFKGLPKGLLKGQTTSLLKKLDIPTRFKGDLGLDVDLPEKLVSDTLQGLTKYVWGKTVGGSFGDIKLETAIEFTLSSLLKQSVGVGLPEGSLDIPVVGDASLNAGLNSNPITGLLTGEPLTGSGQFFEHLGAWIDGRAELFPTVTVPPGMEPGPVPASPTPTATPTGTPTGTPIAPPPQAAPIPSTPIAPMPPPAPGPVPVATPAAPVATPTPTDAPPATPTPTPTGPPKPGK